MVRYTERVDRRIEPYKQAAGTKYDAYDIRSHQGTKVDKLSVVDSEGFAGIRRILGLPDVYEIR